MSKYSGQSKWPDLMVNLRKTCQIELTDIHPQHVVCAWLGNSEDVAKKHYLKVTDGHMAAGSLLTVSQKAGPEPAVMPSHAVPAKSQTLENKAYHVMSYHDMPAIGGQVGDEGLEPGPSSSRETHVLEDGNAPCDALTVNDPQLQLLIEAWPTLSRQVQQQVMLLVG